MTRPSPDSRPRFGDELEDDSDLLDADELDSDLDTPLPDLNE